MVRSKDRHSVHSPFMAEFIEHVFRSKELPEDVENIELFRKTLVKDNRVIQVVDQGAGSHKSNGSKRPISEIARHAAKPKRDAAILYRAAKFLRSKNVLELGTSLGLTSLYLSSDPEVALTTLEGCPHTLGIAQGNFEIAARKNIRPVLGNFKKTLPEVVSVMDRIDLAFVDGDHRKVPTLYYFELIIPKLHNDSLVVFDDIHWSPEMEAAWEQIKQDKRSRVTVDIHRMGFVFFRKEMTPQHFDLRY